MVDHIIKCFIQSVAIDRRVDYWKDIKSKTKMEYIELNTIEKNERGSNIGQGFIINDYVITCRHIIGSEEKTKCFYFEDNRLISKQLIFVGEIKNYDICILKFYDSRVEYFDFLRTFEKLLKNDDTIISNNLKPEEMIDVSYYDFDQTENKLTNIKSTIEYIETKNTNLKSMLMPRIPIHLFKLNKITHGSSGTLAFYNKIPVGMIDFKTKDKIGVIPIEIIYELLKSKLNINHSTIKFKYKIVEIEDECYKFGLILTENITLETNTKRVTLKSDYIILEISNCAITDIGILNKQLNMYVDLDFHFLLQDELVDICYNKNDSEDDKNIWNSFNKILINTTKSPISIDHSHNYYFYKGLIFTELSEELIYYYKKVYSIKEDRYINNFWNMNLSEKIVVLIDRQEEILKREYRKYTDLIKLLDNKHILILRKLGRYNITSLEKLKDIIDSEKENTFTIEKETSLYDIIL